MDNYLYIDRIFDSCCCRGGFRHAQHVRPNRGPHKNGALTWGKRCLCMSFLTISRQSPSNTHRGSAPGHRWGTSVWFPPCKNSCGRPWGPPHFFWTGPGFE